MLIDNLGKLLFQVRYLQQNESTLYRIAQDICSELLHINLSQARDSKRIALLRFKFLTAQNYQDFTHTSMNLYPSANY